MDYHIRHFDTHADHEACVALQERVWSGDVPVPTNMTITVQRHGGVTLGAFDRTTGEMIGFVLGLLSPAHQPGANRGLSHHSHIAAIAPERQGQGIGEALKRAQATWCVSQGLNLMTWTVDPLEAKNARLNVGKLGCICRTFIPNLYGNMTDVLNAGLPSDRFEVEWWLDRQRVNDEWRMANGELSFATGPSQIAIEIPRDFQALKRVDFEAARRWRMTTREQFQRAFAGGYLVTGFTLEGDNAYYTLTHSGANMHG
jgi:predicted GNAT superfamily acetyltransferase